MTIAAALQATHLHRSLLLLASAFAIPELMAGELVQGSHCGADETVYYNCFVEEVGKIASVCGARPNGVHAPGSSIQYRFGPIGRPEFQFPSELRRSVGTFHFEHQSTRDGSTQDYFLWFRSGTWIYEVYYREEFENCSETGCSTERTGQAAYVSVWRGAEAWRTGDEARGRYFRCSNPSDNESFLTLEREGLYRPQVKAQIFGGGDG